MFIIKKKLNYNKTSENSKIEPFPKSNNTENISQR